MVIPSAVAEDADEPVAEDVDDEPVAEDMPSQVSASESERGGESDEE